MGVPDPRGALTWVNNMNRRTIFTKYYSVMSGDQSAAAIACEMSLSGVHFDLLFNGPHGPGTFQSLGGWARAMLNLLVQSTTEGCREIVGTMGGGVFPPSDQGLMTLLGVVG